MQRGRAPAFFPANFCRIWNELVSTRQGCNTAGHIRGEIQHNVSAKSPPPSALTVCDSLARGRPRNRFAGAWYLVLRAGMSLPERVDRTRRKPFAIDARTEDMAKEHGTKEEGDGEFFVEHSRENAAIDTAPQKFFQAGSRTLHHSCSPCAAEFLISRGVCNQMRHQSFLHISLAGIRLVQQKRLDVRF